jgi:hypothetical protein
MSTAKWREMIILYTQKRFTYQTDILPALTGITNRIRGDKYYGGLWKSTLAYDLTWFTVASRGIEALPWPSRPSSYIAPSFLWASVIGNISFVAVPRAANIIMQRFSILDISCQPKIEDTIGELSGGFLTLKGRLIEANFVNAFPRAIQPQMLYPPETRHTCLTGTLKVKDGEYFLFHLDTTDVSVIQKDAHLVCFDLFRYTSGPPEISIALVLQKADVSSPLSGETAAAAARSNGSLYSRIGIIDLIFSAYFEKSREEEITIV